MNIIGETIQNGEPSPEHPVEIENKTNILLAIEILKKLKTAKHHIQVDKPDGGEEIFELPYLSSIEQQAIETVLEELENKQDDINILQAQRDSMEYQFKQAKLELEKKDKRLNRQFKLLQKKDKEIEELKSDNSHQWEERCKLTLELEKKDSLINEQLKENVRLQNELNEENKRCMILANNDKFKEQVIDEMAKYIKEPYQLYIFKGRMSKLDSVKQYFTKKVEGK